MTTKYKSGSLSKKFVNFEESKQILNDPVASVTPIPRKLSFIGSLSYTSTWRFKTPFVSFLTVPHRVYSEPDIAIALLIKYCFSGI